MRKEIVVVIGFVLTLLLFLGGVAVYIATPDAGSVLQRAHTVTVGGIPFRVHIAETPEERMQGLSGKERIKENEGMLFIFDSPYRYGFWMKEMKFPIDIIWISGDRVIGFSEGVPPEPGRSLGELTVYYSPGAVDRVLEVNGGVVARYNIREGDKIRIISD